MSQVDTADRDFRLVALLGLSLAASYTYTFGYGIPLDGLQFPLLHIYDMYPFHTSPSTHVWKTLAVAFVYVLAAFSLSFLVTTSTHAIVYRQDEWARKKLVYAMAACTVTSLLLQLALISLVKWYPSDHIETWKTQQLHQNETSSLEEDMPSVLELNWMSYLWSSSDQQDQTEEEEQDEHTLPRLRYIISLLIQLVTFSFAFLYDQLHESMTGDVFQATVQQKQHNPGNVLFHSLDNIVYHLFVHSPSFLLAFVGVFGWCLSMTMIQFGQYMIATTLLLHTYRTYVRCLVKYHDELWAVCVIAILVMLVLKHAYLTFPVLAISLICTIDYCLRPIIVSH